MANGTVAIKLQEEPVWASIPRNTRREILNATDKLVAQEIHGMARAMYIDLVTLGANWASVSTGKARYADEFKSKYYDVFEKKWDTYRNAYETLYNNPNSEKAFQRYSDSVKGLFNTLQVALKSYVNDRTDLWFRYVDEVAKPLDQAYMASLVLIPFTVDWSAVTAAISKGFSLAAKKLTRKVLEREVKKSVAKNIFRKELFRTISRTMAYPVTGSIAAQIGEGVSSSAFIGPKIAREAAERSSFLNAIVNLPPDAKERKDIEQALESVLPGLSDVYLNVISDKTMKEMGNMNPISHMNWRMMAIYAVYALPFLPAKATKPIREAISKAMKRKVLMPSTIAPAVQEFP